ncbi:MAG: ABC transporter ATP-binding protein [Actinomycetota bacterium]|jgi:branched-chain amino acid transport system ATP-binding protein|nr:ABC transporter ATP-binding protein [Actinomycetota bacterium]
MAVLEVDNLGIRFGGLQALEAVTFKAEEYEIVGLMGPNGAGKTTAFNCITGLYEPTTGTVSYRGRDVTSLRPDQRAALGIGRTFQQVGLVRTMTVLQNLLTAQHARIRYSAGEGMFGAPTSVTEERALERRAMEVLDFMGLTHLAHTKLAGLPYGTLKMVEASAVLATDPDLLLLDEPSAGMSPEESHEFGDLLLDIRRTLGVTIVMIEHHVPMVVGVCDYIYVLNFGRLLAEGLPKDIQSHPEVISAYFGEEDTYGAA